MILRIYRNYLGILRTTRTCCDDFRYRELSLVNINKEGEKQEEISRMRFLRILINF